MAICKHPEEVCGNMTLYRGKTYCDNLNGFCSLHDELPLLTNADRLRAMSDDELADFLENTHTNMAIKLGGEYIVRAKEYIEMWLKQPVE